MRRWAKVRKATWTDDRNAISKYLLPAFGHTPIGMISRLDVWELLDGVGAVHPGAANRLRSLLSRMFSLAVDWGYLPPDSVNPAKGIKKYPENVRDRYLSREEHARLEAALCEERCHYVRAFIRLLLLTGMRKGEMLKLEWDNVDLELGEIVIYKPKNRKTHYLPLTERAIEILTELRTGQIGPYVFPGFDPKTNLPVANKPRATMDTAWRKLRSRAGLDDVWIHDLRRTAASWLAQEGVSLYLIGQILNHSTPGITARYARFQKTDIREALNLLARRIDLKESA